jgi:predicted O-methyltransferase YrrM
MAFTSEVLETYLSANASAEDPILTELAHETHLKIQMPQMLSGHVQGLFLEMLSKMIVPRRILEIGTFTGYATICLAKGLPPDGLLYTLDINEELEPLFSKYFIKSGLDKKIKFIAGNAIKNIPEIDEQFDLVFIDADKMNYSNYYDLVIDKVRPGGYILSDNVLWSGKVLDREKQDKETVAIRDFNQKLRNDPRIQNVIVPIRDGIHMARKS